ncbi:RHS domain-containing protein [Salmonella bongori]|nr:RHS domain-containing protein [Salmonella bongori]
MAFMDMRYLKIMTVRAGLSARSSMTSRNGTPPTRVADREQYPALPAMWRDNRISKDMAYFYHHDEHGRLTEKDERRIRDGGSHSHHYHYDNQHRLLHYRCVQQGAVLLESRYLYDPLGRRIGKRVWKSRRERGSLSGEEYIYLNKTPEVTWYGWDGDRLVTTQTDMQRVQTIYLPGSFTPLVRIETETSELAKAVRRTLAEKFQQEANVTFPPELVAMVDSLEAELQRGELSEANRAWLAQCGLTPEQIQNQMEPEYIPQRKIHLYHCDHRGLPLGLVSIDGKIEWSAEYDAWGNVLRENNPHNIEQHIRLPGQQYDEETGLYYNRHRYYDPSQGRYITQDPIGLEGGWNSYSYVKNNPVNWIDPLGLAHTSGKWKDCGKGCRIRIDGDAVGDGRHLHWECKNGSGVMGEFGGQSHGDDYSSAPNSIKKCARKYGFEPEQSKLTCKDSETSATEAVVATGATIGMGYIIYRVIRMIPSLAPPLWPTIPVNVVTP